MLRHIRYPLFAVMAIACMVVSPEAMARTVPETFLTDLAHAITGPDVADGILKAATDLFWALATISLVWTMGVFLTRHDIGEALMELVRFIVVTGTFYWLLINASGSADSGGFVDSIVQSFFEMIGQSEATYRKNADGVLAVGLRVYFNVLLSTADGDAGDKVLIGLIATGILVAAALMAAQFLLTLIMAWLMGYAAIFLLGFGGARWTSSIAISYYKHVLAIAVAMLCLGLIGTAASTFLGDLLDVDPMSRSKEIDFEVLGFGIAAMVLLTVLSIRVPQMMYTLVTGSTLGLFAGTAGMVGSAIATGGSAAIAVASRGGGGGERGSGGSQGNGGGSGSGSGRSESVMDAVQRSASGGAAGDAFHVGTGADPFGVSRTPSGAQSGGSAFRSPSDPVVTSASKGDLVSAINDFGRDLGLSEEGLQKAGSLPAAEAKPGQKKSGSNVSTGEAVLASAAPVSGSSVMTDRPDYAGEMQAVMDARGDLLSTDANVESHAHALIRTSEPATAESLRAEASTTDLATSVDIADVSTEADIARDAEAVRRGATSSETTHLAEQASPFASPTEAPRGLHASTDHVATELHSAQDHRSEVAVLGQDRSGPTSASSMPITSSPAHDSEVVTGDIATSESVRESMRSSVDESPASAAPGQPSSAQLHDVAISKDHSAVSGLSHVSSDASLADPAQALHASTDQSATQLRSVQDHRPEAEVTGHGTSASAAAPSMPTTPSSTNDIEVTRDNVTDSESVHENVRMNVHDNPVSTTSLQPSSTQPNDVAVAQEHPAVSDLSYVPSVASLAEPSQAVHASTDHSATELHSVQVHRPEAAVTGHGTSASAAAPSMPATRPSTNDIEVVGGDVTDSESVHAKVHLNVHDKPVSAVSTQPSPTQPNDVAIARENPTASELPQVPPIASPQNDASTEKPS